MSSCTILILESYLENNWMFPHVKSGQVHAFVRGHASLLIDWRPANTRSQNNDRGSEYVPNEHVTMFLGVEFNRESTEISLQV